MSALDDDATSVMTDGDGNAATEDDGDGADEADANPADAEETGVLSEETVEPACAAASDPWDGVGEGDDDGAGSMTCAIANAPSRQAMPTAARRLCKL